MKKRFAGNAQAFAKAVCLALLCALLFTNCKFFRRIFGSNDGPSQPREQVSRQSLNLLFQPGTPADVRQKTVSQIQNNIRGYFDSLRKDNPGITYTLKIDTVYWCPCDSLLYTFKFEYSGINASGEPVPTTKPSKGTVVQGGGDLIDLDYNDTLSDIEKKGVPETRKGIAGISSGEVDPSKVLAIMDAGIDLKLFKPFFATDMLWRESIPAQTLFNFLPGADKFNPVDKTSSHHGSAVTAIAIDAIGRNSKAYPKVMVLKVLDDQNVGSVFSVSCALSYAIQNKATVVNASLGYIGEEDPILSRYFELAAKNKIEIFTAAGNAPEPHSRDSLCIPSKNPNELRPGHLFYPGCFSTKYDNITNVAQITSFDSSCLYQNYSNTYVNLGVYSKEFCCYAKVIFAAGNPSYYEGTSFASPVASGIRMRTILNPPSSTQRTWPQLLQHSPTLTQIKNGQYIIYSP